MHTTRTAAVLALSLSLAAASLTACSNGDQTSAAGTAGSGAQGGSVKKIGLMVQDLSNPFFVSMQHGVEARAKAIGATVSTQDGRQDLGTQNDQIDAFIQQQIDVLLINAVDSKGIGSAVTRARAAGIKVIAVDVAAQGADATITSDNVQAGQQACTYLADAIGRTGKVLIVDGPPVSAVQDRMKGCKDVLAAKYPQVTVAATQTGDGGRAKALTLTADMLTANGDAKGVFAINDPSALGAVLAATQAGKNTLVVTGVDGSPEAVKELKNAGSMFRMTSAQDPNRLGVEGLEMGIKLKKGEQVAESDVKVPVSVVDTKTVADYKGWQ